MTFYCHRAFAESAGVSPETVAEWCNEGLIPAQRIGRRWIIAGDLLARQIEEDWVKRLAERAYEASERRRIAISREKRKGKRSRLAGKNAPRRKRKTEMGEGENEARNGEKVGSHLASVAGGKQDE